MWTGPAAKMDSNWGGCAEIKGKALAALKVGDALKLHVSKTKPGSAVKIMDINDSYPTAISGVSIQKRSADNVIYSIDGRSVGNDTTKLLSGVYVMNGKKFVVR